MQGKEIAAKALATFSCFHYNSEVMCLNLPQTLLRFQMKMMQENRVNRPERELHEKFIAGKAVSTTDLTIYIYCTRWCDYFWRCVFFLILIYKTLKSCLRWPSAVKLLLWMKVFSLLQGRGVRVSCSVFISSTWFIWLRWTDICEQPLQLFQWLVYSTRRRIKY